uniref:Chemotaxis protein CheW n=1 Tax=Caldicellulosiruptor owensensis TaxID=55205 RepID=A0A7C5V4L4_9FIRM
MIDEERKKLLKADIPEDFEEEDELTDEKQLVIFKLGNEEYGVDIMQVKEIIKMTNITKIPQVPSFVEGIISLRGEILPIIDMRKKFGLPAGEKTRQTRILVINLDNVTIGGIVDEVTEVLRLPNDAITPPPPVIRGINTEYLQGVGQINGRIIILLDMSKILTSNEVIQIEELKEELLNSDLQ